VSKDLRDGGLASVTIEDILAPGFSTPWDAPTIPPFPFSFRNAEVLTLVWRTTEAAVKGVLPPPLQPTSDIVLAHIYRMTDTDWLGSYGEANVSVGAELASSNLKARIRPTCFSPRTSASPMAAKSTGNPRSSANRGSNIATTWLSEPSCATA
jgi:acetoacetate decarboxylase